MKRKVFIIILILLAIIVAGCLVFFIKEKYIAQKNITSSEDCVRRHFLNKALWYKWNVGNKINDNTFKYNNIEYKITKVLYNTLQITISNKKDSLQGNLYFVGNAEKRNCIVYYETYELKQSNFIDKFKHSQTIKHLQSAIDDLMNTIESYFNSQKKVYGFEIKKERTTDFYLQVSQSSFNQKPTTLDIYKIIEKIKNHIDEKKGVIKNAPMLNIYKEDSSKYNVMVALPTINEVEETKEIKYKKLVEGNILVAEIKGGLHTIEKAEQELKNYIDDTKRMAPAIPYQSLITNRITETDTSKWVTKLYYPIFY